MAKSIEPKFWQDFNQETGQATSFYEVFRNASDWMWHWVDFAI
jgi:hypothetical protein